jgi:hypothetical protein
MAMLIGRWYVREFEHSPEQTGPSIIFAKKIKEKEKSTNKGTSDLK